MRLENQYDTIVPKRRDRVKDRVELSRMMRVVIVDMRPVETAFIFNPPSGAGISGEPFYYRLSRKPERYRGGGSRKCV